MFAVECVINRENMNSFTKLLFRNKQVNLKKLTLYFMGILFYFVHAVNRYELLSRYRPDFIRKSHAVTHC